jgi:hypothetical protein
VAVGGPNPFSYGALALDEAFTDREAELAELTADVDNGQDVVVFAPRRYGKSSLVWKASQQLVGRDVLVAQVDLMTTPTKEKLAEKLARTIYEDVASALFRVRERARVFQGLRVSPTVTVDPDDGSLSFGFAAGRAPEDIDVASSRGSSRPTVAAASHWCSTSSRRSSTSTELCRSSCAPSSKPSPRSRTSTWAASGT